MPRRIQTYDSDDQTVPTDVGSISVSRGKFEAMLTMPRDALMPVLQMLIAEKLKFIDLHGERMRYRSTPIRSYQLEMHGSGMICQPMPESLGRPTSVAKH